MSVSKPTLVLILLSASLAGCATTDRAAAPLYTSTQVARMTYCVGLSDTARAIAQSKQEKRPMQSVMRRYADRPDARLQTALVKKVYAEEVTSVWDYTVRFFGECTANLAGVYAQHQQPARGCMQKQLIADIAYAYRAAGKAKSAAYAHFHSLQPKAYEPIVDGVYASTDGRAKTKMAVWNACIAEYR